MKAKFKRAVREAQARLPDQRYVCHAYDELAYKRNGSIQSELHHRITRYCGRIFAGRSLEEWYCARLGHGSSDSTAFCSVWWSVAEKRNRMLRYELARYIVHLCSSGVPAQVAKGLIHRRIKNWIKKNRATWEAQNI